MTVNQSPRRRLVNPIRGNTRAVMLTSMGSQLNAPMLEPMLGVQRLITHSAMTCYREGPVLFSLEKLSLSVLSQGRIAKVSQSFTTEMSGKNARSVKTSVLS